MNTFVQENENSYVEEKKNWMENSNWDVEEERVTQNSQGHYLKISRLIHKQDKGKRNPRRLIAVGKKNKSIGIDMESVFGVTAIMRLLAEPYVPQDLK